MRTPSSRHRYEEAEYLKAANDEKAPAKYRERMRASAEMHKRYAEYAEKREQEKR